MADMEKVLQALEHCDLCSDMPNCPGCAYLRESDCMEHLKRDIIALLKAQEPKLVHVTANINHRKIGECPTCGKLINSGDYPNNCGRCGQAVKWE